MHANKIRTRTVDLWCEYGLFSVPLFYRNSPHPFITALENRVDCWPALLLEIDDFIVQAADRFATTEALSLSLLQCMNYKAVCEECPSQITNRTTGSCYCAVMTNAHRHIPRHIQYRTYHISSLKARPPIMVGGCSTHK